MKSGKLKYDEDMAEEILYNLTNLSFVDILYIEDKSILICMFLSVFCYQNQAY